MKTILLLTLFFFPMSLMAQVAKQGPGINAYTASTTYVLKAGDTMTGTLVAPAFTANTGDLTVSNGIFNMTRTTYSAPDAVGGFRIKFRDLGGFSNDAAFGMGSANEVWFNHGISDFVSLSGKAGDATTKWKLDQTGRAEFAGNIISSGTGTNYFAGQIYVPANTDATGPGIMLGYTTLYGTKLWQGTGGNIDTYFDLQQDNANNKLYFRTRTLGTPLSIMTVGSGGVSIGTTTAGADLTVSGSDTGIGIYNTGNINVYTKDTAATDKGGSITLGGENGTATTPWPAAKIKGGRSAIGGNNGYLSFFTNSGASILERMRIDTAGKMGLGTTLPNSKLEISDANEALGLGYTGFGNLFIGSSNSQTPDFGGVLALGGFYNGAVGQNAFAKISGRKTNGNSGDLGGYLAFETANNDTAPYSFERMRITTDGKVGIGVSIPGSNLDVRGSLLLSQAGLNHSFTSIDASSLGNTLLGSGGTYGGAALKGFTAAAGVVGVDLSGYQGSAAPTAPAVRVMGAKASGSGAQALAAGEKVFSVLNYTNELMTVTGNGFVGISTNTPSNNLHIKGSIRIQESSTINSGYLNFASGLFKISDNNDERLAINMNTGFVGIATTSPSSKLHIASGTITMDGTDSPAKGYALCLTAGGKMSTCSTVVAADGTCTCTP